MVSYYPRASSLFSDDRRPEVDPLLAFAFLQSFVEILQEYFETVSAATLKDNFDVVYQVRYFPKHRIIARIYDLTQIADSC